MDLAIARSRFLLALTVFAIVAAGGRPGEAADTPFGISPAEIARQVDATLAGELSGQSPSTPATKIAGDETFLHRVSQDLIGELPTPDEVTAFVLDPSADKRARQVERLLADPRFGRNWARYFRDVILYRRTDERAVISGPSMATFLAEQLNSGVGWDKIAHAFITATGDVREQGETGLIMAQMGQAPEIAAEMARIFLGVQIQCAQCHDHKTDRWKRTQFHELAAFFPRIAIRPVREGDKRVSFEVASRNAPPARPPQDGKPRGKAEHFMPDLDDPSAAGTQMQPVFFLTGQQVPFGNADADRPKALAEWFTDRQNRWFARAFVNRIWAELVGQGFYEPIDDLGPDRTPTAPQTLDILSAAFVDHGYDVKWLMSSIISTETYQHESRSPRDDAARAFAANCPQPLRADQLFNALTTALAIDESQLAPPGPPGPQRGARGPRAEFDRTFGYDPSAPRDEIGPSIPQALLMMNSPLLNRTISSKSPGSVLETLLAENRDNEFVTVELYLRCLAREPKPEELSACLSHVERIGDRAEAFEDILWALVNATEFTHRK